MENIHFVLVVFALGSKFKEAVLGRCHFFPPSYCNLKQIHGDNDGYILDLL